MPEPGRVSFPVSKAIAFSARSVRIRLGRMVIVVMGIASAIAFVTVLLSLDLVVSGITAGAQGESDAGLAQFKVWWLVVALLIAVTGITNAILMSVTERIKEIGTIRCLGAMGRHVVMIFLFESLFLGLVGGAIGGISGILFTLIYATASYGTGVLGAVSWGSLAGMAAAGTGLSMALCVISAVYPVMFAARLQPADAMRYEV